MKRLLLALALSTIASTSWAQCSGVFANNTLCGNATGSSGPPRPTASTSFPAAVANPTGTIGLSTVNGSAATAMRSDGAPPLSQSIVPTWTGVHTFNGNVVFGGTVRGITVPTTTALKALSLTNMVNGAVIVKTGYYAAGDMPPITYTLSTSACSSADDGAQIASDTVGNCWLMNKAPVYDIRWWGAKDDWDGTTATGTNSATQIQAAIDYAATLVPLSNQSIASNLRIGFVPITGGGGFYAIDTSLSVKAGVCVTHMSLAALAGSWEGGAYSTTVTGWGITVIVPPDPWSGDAPVGMLNFNAQNGCVRNVWLEGNFRTDISLITIQDTKSGITIDQVQGAHFSNYGIWNRGNNVKISNVEMAQSSLSDATKRTGYAFFQDGGDTECTHCLFSYAYVPVYVSYAAVDFNLLAGSHLFNGWSGASASYLPINAVWNGTGSIGATWDNGSLVMNMDAGTGKFGRISFERIFGEYSTDGRAGGMACWIIMNLTANDTSTDGGYRFLMSPSQVAFPSWKQNVNFIPDPVCLVKNGFTVAQPTLRWAAFLGNMPTLTSVPSTITSGTVTPTGTLVSGSDKIAVSSCAGAANITGSTVTDTTTGANLTAGTRVKFCGSNTLYIDPVAAGSGVGDNLSINPNNRILALDDHKAQIYLNPAAVNTDLLLRNDLPAGWEVSIYTDTTAAGTLTITPQAGATINGVGAAFTMAPNNAYILRIVSNAGAAAVASAQ